MSVRPIVLFPDPVLLTPTRDVTDFGDRLATLVRDLTDTMIAAPGIGLAANQLGEGVRVCVVDPSAGERPGELRVLVNPRVIHEEGRQTEEEGCLSFPGINLDVERAERIQIEAVDPCGKEFELEAEGLLARVILHEVEHLDGQTFLRNVSALRREMVKREIRKKMKNGDWVATAVR